MTVVYVYCLVALAAAAIVALVRMERGPSILDRVVTLDIITAVVLGAVAVVSAITGRADLVPVLVVMSMVGFVGSVTVARFVAVEGAEEARILSKEELEAVLAEQHALDDEAAPVHDPDALDEQERDGGDMAPVDGLDAADGQSRRDEPGPARTEEAR